MPLCRDMNFKLCSSKPPSLSAHGFVFSLLRTNEVEINNLYLCKATEGGNESVCVIVLDYSVLKLSTLFTSH